ncbi:MAG: ATP-dependent zinc metalloprotease FtsH [Lentisphaeraceae bacterium]|nr:ATP-dependent zinc metalloprotease FtsH [Lentisphaeraceae bacterium]
MSENNNDNNKTPKDGGGEDNTPPSFPNKLIWLIIIILPISLLIFSEKKSAVENNLDQTVFEQYLKEGKVSKVTVVHEKGYATSFTAKVELVPGVTGIQLPEAIKDKPGPLVLTVNIIDLPGVKNLCTEKNVPFISLPPKEETMKEVLGMILPLLVIVFIIYFLFSRQLKNAGRGAMQFGKSKAKLMSPSSEKVTFADVAGIEEARSEVEEIVDFLKDPEKYRNLGGRLPKGCLMVGPPGTGKTLLARAIAGEAKVPFYSMSGSDFVEMFVGVGASRVRDMFEQAKKSQPCILFIDEIDAVGRARNASAGGGGGHDEREQTLNALLVEMDGFENQHGVIILAATNRADVLDPALLRPGRFDRRIVVDLPDVEGRLQILKVHARKVKMAASVDLRSVAKGTAGFAGADLANVINEAALLAAGAGKKAITSDDLEEARDKVRWGKERKSRKMSEKEQRLTAYHEAGHTLVGLYCEHATPLHKVTIMPRGNAYLGATMYLPDKDQYTQSRSELLDSIAVAMGGRIAEELEFGEITNGASSDIKSATAIARHMVRDWGMSDRVGFIQYSHDEQQQQYQFTNEYSDTTGRMLDEEVRKIIDEEFERAKQILVDNRDQLTLLSETLLKKETMSAVEVKKLLGMKIEEPVSEEVVDDKKDDSDDGEAITVPVEVGDEASAEKAEADNPAEETPTTKPVEGLARSKEDDSDEAAKGKA